MAPTPRKLLPSLVLLAALAPGSAAVAGSRINLITREKIVLEVRPLTASPVARTPSPLLLEVDPETGGTLEFDVHWPDESDRSTVRLKAGERGGSNGKAGPIVTVFAEVLLPDGKRVSSERRIATDRSSTILFEVARSKSRSLTLGLQAEIVTTTSVEAGAVLGAPVRLMLDVQRVIDGREILLETNHLNTFVGEPVSYSFRLGPPDDTAITVQLKPLHISGELLKLEVEISGTLPGSEATHVTSRREEWITSRGASSTAALEVGDPPSGYRFVITPQF